jgi:hypothetical protein
MLSTTTERKGVCEREVIYKKLYLLLVVVIN